MQRTVATTDPDGGGMHAWRAILVCAAGDRSLGGGYSGGCMLGVLAWRRGTRRDNASEQNTSALLRQSFPVAYWTDVLASVGANLLTVCPPADTMPLAPQFA
jgi:hypothetical protein